MTISASFASTVRSTSAATLTSDSPRALHTHSPYEATASSPSDTTSQLPSDNDPTTSYLLPGPRALHTHSTYEATASVNQATSSFPIASISHDDHKGSTTMPTEFDITTATATTTSETDNPTYLSGSTVATMSCKNKNTCILQE